MRKNLAPILSIIGIIAVFGTFERIIRHTYNHSHGFIIHSAINIIYWIGALVAVSVFITVSEQIH